MTYSELKAAIVAWSKRADITAQVDTFIDLFEARASRNLRAFEMETLETVTPTSEFQALPDGFIAFRNVQLNGTYPQTLGYASPQKIATTGLTTGSAKYYTINGNQVEFSPSAEGSEIEWTYFKSIPGLSDSNTSNWLLAKYPDYYLMGCIQQAAFYALNPRADQLEGMLQNHENSINRAAKSVMSGPMTVVAD